MAFTLITTTGTISQWPLERKLHHQVNGVHLCKHQLFQNSHIAAFTTHTRSGIQQIMCCSHLLLTGGLQGSCWDHLWYHHRQLLVWCLLLFSPSSTRMSKQCHGNSGNDCFLPMYYWLWECSLWSMYQPFKHSSKYTCNLLQNPPAVSPPIVR